MHSALANACVTLRLPLTLHLFTQRNNFRACAVARERFKLHAALVQSMEAPHAI